MSEVTKADMAAMLKPGIAKQSTAPADSFEGMLAAFKACPCPATSFSAATQLFKAYPEEAKALLPKIKPQQLTLDGVADDASGVWEYSAVLTAAKYAENKLTHKAIAMQDVTIDDVMAPRTDHKDAPYIYKNHSSCSW